jgi:hypothetical protein
MKMISAKYRWVICLIGSPIVMLVALYLYLAFSRATFQETYNSIQNGMTMGEVQSILSSANMVLDSGAGGHHRMFLTYSEPDLLLFSGRKIWLTFDDDTEKLLHKSIELPNWEKTWKGWKEKVGL